MVKQLKTMLGAVLLLFLLVLSACGENYKSFTLSLEDSFNTTNTVTIFSLEDMTSEEKEQLWDEVNQILVDLDRRFNIQPRDDSYETELMKINNNAGIAPLNVSDEMIYVLKKAIEMSEISTVDGVALFDPTIAPVWNLWDFVNKIYFSEYDNREEIPSQEQILEKLSLVDYRKILIDEENKTVFLKQPGMKIDLGAVVKGYAADKVKTYLVELGFTKAIIDIGRNIQTLGVHFDKQLNDRPWSVKLQTPFIDPWEEDNLQYFGRLWVEDCTVVTSGTYEKYIMDNEGNMYHHILDPRTGYPFANSVLSVTVITDLSITGDCFSTTLFSLGLDRGMEVIRQTEGLEAVWVVKNGSQKEVYISDGLADNFEFNNSVESKGYVYKGVY